MTCETTEAWPIERSQEDMPRQIETTRLPLQTMSLLADGHIVVAVDMLASRYRIPPDDAALIVMQGMSALLNKAGRDAARLRRALSDACGRRDVRSCHIIAMNAVRNEEGSP